MSRGLRADQSSGFREWREKPPLSLGRIVYQHCGESPRVRMTSEEHFDNAQHGIESIGDGDDPCPERNLFAAQLARIAAAIEELMVGENDIGDFAQEGMRVSML